MSASLSSITRNPSQWETVAASLRRAALAVARPSGPTLPEELMIELAAALGVPLAFVGVFDEAQHRLHAIAGVLDGKPLAPFDLEQASLPEAARADAGFLHCARGTLAGLAQDSVFAAHAMDSFASLALHDSAGVPLGLLVAMDRAPMRDTDWVEAMLTIFGARLAAEVERTRADDALRSAALAVSGAQGDGVLGDLVAALARILRVDAAFIAVQEAQQPASLHRVAQVVDGRATEALHYTLDGTPCETVIGRRFRAYSSDLVAHFPRDAELRDMGAQSYAGFSLLDRNGQALGIISVVSRQRLRHLGLVEAILQIFAVRAAAEVERLRADETLRLREEQYRVIFEAASDGFVLRDGSLRTLDANPAFYRMYGFEREHIARGGGYPAHFPQAYVEEREAQIRHALEGHETHVETRALRADGSPFWIDLRVIPVRYRGAPHVLQVVRDITARREAQARHAELEAQLRQAQKMEAIGLLTGGIAHDFNNILTSVIGYLVLAGERAARLDDPRLRHQLAQAELAAQRARELIAQMLTFARGGRGAASERAALALAPVLRQSLSLLRSTLPSSIELEHDLADSLPAVAAEAVQIEQVLFNLCINARDAMAGAGRLRVTLQERRLETQCASCRSPLTGHWVELAVADDGCGVAADVRERMFDPFYTTKEVGHGSGMGLAMVHGIVHDHGGHIAVDSAPGEGTVFRVLLPAAAVPPEAAVAPSTPPSAPVQVLRGRVLLVEDQAMVGAFMSELLGGWGLAVTLCRDPVEAQRRVAAEPDAFDLVITDQTMPRLTGVELARQLLAVRPALPVLLYTGFDEGLDEAELKRLGLRAVLHKPIDRAQLLAALRACL